jgi:hypothetical protein
MICPACRNETVMNYFCATCGNRIHRDSAPPSGKIVDWGAIALIAVIGILMAIGVAIMTHRDHVPPAAEEPAPLR